MVVWLGCVYIVDMDIAASSLTESGTHTWTWRHLCNGKLFFDLTCGEGEHGVVLLVQGLEDRSTKRNACGACACAVL